MNSTSARIVPPVVVAALGVLLAVVLAAGSFLTTGSSLPIMGLGLLLVVVAGAVYLWGAEAPLLGAIVIVPLIPNTTIGFAAGGLGGQWGELRAVLLVLLLGVYLACFPRGVPRLPRVLIGVTGSLVALAGAGMFAAVTNGGSSVGFLAEAAHGAGQPLIYALLIVAVAAALQSREGARERLLAAVCIAILGQAIVVVAGLATGAAYDPVRQITRAQGTVGANFLSAMAMLGFFAGLSLRSGSTARRFRSLGIVTAVAALAIIAVATTRGGLVGVFIGVAYVVLTGVDARARIATVAALAVLMVALTTIPQVSGLWSERLDWRGGITDFDRVATWISGVRMGLDDPLGGLGNAGVAEGVAEVSRYQQTPAGPTSVVPHNIWILAFAEAGIAGLLMSLVFSFFFCLAIWRRPRRRSLPDRFLVGGLLGLIAVSLINNLFTHPEVMLPGFVFLAVVCSGALAGRRLGQPVVS
ncbi:MAG: O-antigen ligase domain-containing protein [Acidobacteria bacterium]|nr:MAG: O-antigen ligase domain-containing protein [Acidobacteriota bacterium]GIK76710.1 MAG: hypothetical protein BroJett022_04000 [Actinomycetes bacterium]